MFDPAKFAMQMIQNNPQVMNNPMAKQYLEIIQNGDSAKGQEVANNILKTYGMTKDQAMRIYISDVLSGQELETVLIHELGHAALFSYGLLPDIHKAVKRQYWMEAEEWVCNFIADYGMRIFSIAYEVMGEDAWMFIPYELDRLIA